MSSALAPPPIHALPASIFTFERDGSSSGRIGFGAPSVAALLGIPGADLSVDLGPMLAVLGPAGVETFFTTLDAATAEAGLWSVVLRVGERWIEWQANPADEAPAVRWHGFARDVTVRESARRHARMLEHAINQSAAAIYLLGDDLNFRFVNETACRMLGYSREEFSRMAPADIDAALGPAEMDEINRRRIAGETFTTETKHRTRDGRELPVELTVAPILADGEPLALCVARDISERSRMIEALRRSEHEFRSLAEGSPVSIIRYGRDGRIRYLNQHLAADLNVRPEEVIGRLPGEVWPDGEFAAIEAAVGKAITEGARTIVEFWAALEGSEPRLHQVHVVPELDERGEIVGSLAYGLDATGERMHRLFLRSLIDTLPDAVWQKDREGRYQACNLRFSRMSGYAEAELVGRTDAELGLAELAPCRARADALALGGDTPTVSEEWVRFADDGHQELVETVRTVTRDGLGTPVGVLAIARDVTARRALEAQLRTTASVFEAAREGIIITDPEGVIVDANAACARITGYAREAMLGRTPRILASGLHDRAFYEAMWTALRTQGAWSGEIVNRRADGVLITERLDIVAVRDEPGQVKHYVGVFSDITVLKEHERHLQHIAHHDALTGLPNRLLLADRLDQALAQARRSGDTLAVLYLDLDSFKPINDLHGHHVGDRVLIAIARRLSAALRGGDTVARFGGDEFVAVLTGISGVDECEAIARRLLDSVNTPILLDDLKFDLSASIGISLFPDGDPGDADLLLRHADQAMYLAKAGGRNQFVFHGAHDSGATGGSTRSIHDLRRALAEGRVTVHYQPIFDMGTGRIVKAEALARWLDPERGYVSPAEFIPVAEAGGLIHALGDAVFEASARVAREWSLVSPDAPPRRICINRSPRQFAHRDGVDHWLRRMEELGVDGSMLAVEITEGLLLDDRPEVLKQLAQLREAGITVSLDDFGTGYSAMAYLKKFLIDALKIDRSFVRDIVTDVSDRAIVEAVIAMARRLDIAVVAEGVETREQAELLALVGCDMAQGYWYARPMPEDAFMALVREDPLIRVG